MLFSESWLRSLVNPNLNTDDLSHLMTMAGLEVEETRQVAPAFSGIIVSQVIEVLPHPNADKLKICRVDDGSGELLQIVCGAPNVKAGIKVPLAQIGAVLPGNFKIKKAKMRGEASFGMLCSAKELGVSHDHEGLLILDEQLKLGQDIREALALDETIFEIKLTPNRADCLSILGVAREVAALTGEKLKPIDFSPAPITLDERFKIQIEDSDLCGRFAGRVIRNVDAKAKTPDYIKQRLERAGQRSVSALVDISNYVMLELGRPTHVFDLNKLDSSNQLTVRWAKEGENLKLLNEETIQLNKRCGVITQGDKIQSFAGVMGGFDSAVDLETQDIFVEAAFWFEDAIAGLTREFKLTSEAAYRFERGVDFEHITEHLDYMTRLIQEICGGDAGPISDEIVNLPQRNPVTLRLDRCQKVLGLKISSKEIADIFTQLQLPFTQKDNSFIVNPPSYRFDLTIEEDLIEEVARIYGYDRIPSIEPIAKANILPTHETQRSHLEIRQTLANLDYQEVINYSFVEDKWERDFHANKDPIRLLNPIASQLAVMRSGLIGGLLANVVANAKRKINRVRVFELGKVFFRNESVTQDEMHVPGVEQPIRLGGVAWGSAAPEQWGINNHLVDFFDVKNDIENLFSTQKNSLSFKAEEHIALHPGRSARIYFNDQAIGFMGELHPKYVQALEINQAPILFELAIDALKELPLHRLEKISNQPVVNRDLALWAPINLEFNEILQTIKTESDFSIIKDINLFDIWKDVEKHPDHRSLALRFTLQDENATLEDKRVDQCMKQILELLDKKYQIKQR